MRCGTVVVLLIFCAPLHASARVAQGSAATTAASPQEHSYPNTSDGLRGLLSDIFAAEKAHDTARETSLIQSLLVPEDSTWFVDTYGPGFGASLAGAYSQARPDLEEQIRVIYETDVKRGWTNPKILEYTDPEKVDAPYDRFLNSMNQIVPLYQTASLEGRSATTFALAVGGKVTPMAGDLDGCFIYDRGGFRFIPLNILMKLPSERPVRIHLDMDVMGSKVIQRVPVRMPPEAIKKHISGKVILDAILDVDGNIKELKPVSGDPVLVSAAMDAMKQWRFAPTKLDGDPVEVEFQMEFEFQIN